jgi:hypothetical protein
MFQDMLEALDGGRPPAETFYDGYVVNAIMDAAYRSIDSRRWEPVQLEVWRGATAGGGKPESEAGDDPYLLIKRERMADGRVKAILKNRRTGEVVQRLE